MYSVSVLVGSLTADPQHPSDASPQHGPLEGVRASSEREVEKGERGKKYEWLHKTLRYMFFTNCTPFPRYSST